MSRSTWRAMILAAVIAGQVGILATDARGATIFDWLFGASPQPAQGVVTYYYPSTGLVYAERPAPSYQTNYFGQPTVSYQANYAQQPTVAYSAGASSFCQPAPTCQVEPTICYQAPVACEPPPSSSCQWFGRLFRPRGGGLTQTSYRTVWKQVPVTSFRPVTSADPVTGCPVTVMRPCTTYTWQADRRRCGFFRRLFGQCDPPPAQASTGPTECMATSNCCNPSLPMAAPAIMPPSPTPTPYYAPGSPSPAPSVVPGAMLPPATLSPAPQTHPGAAVMPPAGAIPGGGEADTRPTLKRVDPQSEPSPSHKVPSQPQSYMTPGSATPATPAEANAAPRVPLPSYGTGAAPKGRLRLAPVPGLDATPVDPEESDPPQLLNPRDQMASLRSSQAWGYTMISWPKRSKKPVAGPSRVVQPRENRQPLDESGWTSVRNAAR